ncbi:hypothetical protein LzC2_20040 [Planctomycetes bacterium LzC2]|uniref:Phosphatidate cytidylyltransferase n=1 Tax=Alienimonas chondri TaxID=2681879 RepID=A0ABX1VDG0_9PLAN|nr:hypothetical protein [Alienimonas chondri]
MKSLDVRLALAAGVALAAAIGLTAADRPALAALLCVIVAELAEV